MVSWQEVGLVSWKEMDIISHVLPKKTAASRWKPVSRFTASSSQKATNWERDDFSREGRRSILRRHWAYIHYREIIPVFKPHSLHRDVWSYTATMMWGLQRWTEVSESLWTKEKNAATPQHVSSAQFQWWSCKAKLYLYLSYSTGTLPETGSVRPVEVRSRTKVKIKNFAFTSGRFWFY